MNSNYKLKALFQSEKKKSNINLENQTGEKDLK